MAAVDWELAWLDLKAYIAEKRSHGNRDLALKMAEIEVNRRVPEEMLGYDPSPPLPRRRPPTSRSLSSIGRNG